MIDRDIAESLKSGRGRRPVYIGESDDRCLVNLISFHLPCPTFEGWGYSNPAAASVLELGYVIRSGRP